MTWLLRGLALLLAIGAIVAALIGYQLSTQPPPSQPAPPAESVVKAVKPLRAGEPIRAEDVALQPVAAKPAGSFATPSQVVGQAPIGDVPAGEILNRNHFPTSGQLVRSLRSGERAIAIKVDEVVGLGGFAQPGDRVDVLLYLRGTQETANVSSAQVVLAGVRLLAFGETVQQPAGEAAEGAVARAADKVAGRGGRATTSAVLAVPEAAASRLMLAASTGSLRLSLRPAEAAPAAVAATGAAGADSSQLVRLAELAQASRSSPAVAKPAAVRGPGPAPILIHEGDTVRKVGAPPR